MNKKVNKMVEAILRDDRRARNDDFYLVGKVYEIYYGFKNEPFLEVAYSHQGLPTYESITRIRRKLQADNPLVYGASGMVRRARAKEEEEYRREYGKKY